MYAYDASDVEKRARAIAIVRDLTRSRNGAVSLQVVSEFSSTILRKDLLSVRELEPVVESLLLSWSVLGLEPANIREALRGVHEHQMSYYDALIWATAMLNSIPNLLSEDGQDGQVVEGVRRLNPFRPEFDLSQLS